MGAIADQANVVFRDYETGDTSSGGHKPIKSEIRALFADVEEAAAVAPYIFARDPPYNCVGDGIANDGPAIQAALDAAAAAGGGEVYLGPGRFRCVVAPRIPKNVFLVGAGWDATVILAGGTDIAVLRSMIADGLLGVSNMGARDMTLEATSPAQLYGLYVLGCDNGRWFRIKVSGLEATTGAGWNGTEAAWGFYFSSFIDGLGTLRKSNNNFMAEFRTDDSPNSFNMASSDGTAVAKGGNNNIMLKSYFSGFINTGMDLFGESNVYISCRVNSANNNIVGIRIRDAAVTLIGCDSDSSNGPVIGAAGAKDEYGYPLGVRDNNNIGFLVYDTSSGVLVNPGGNGCRRRFGFQSLQAKLGLQILRKDYNTLSAIIGGILVPANGAKTSSYTLQAEDAGDIVRMNAPTPISLTVPAMASVPLAIGTTAHIAQYGAGLVTIGPEAGVTIKKAPISPLFKTGDDTWVQGMVGSEQILDGSITAEKLDPSAAFAPLAGASFTGNISAPQIIANAGFLSLDRTGDAAAAVMRIQRDAGMNADIAFMTGTSDRWRVRTDNNAESGANAGSNLALIAFDDSGVQIGSVYTVARASRVFGFAISPTAPTPSPGDNTTKLATTQYVGAAIAAIPAGSVVILARSAVPIPNTSSTNGVDFNFVTVNLPVLGPNSCIEVDCLWSFTGSTNAKQCLAKLSASSGIGGSNLINISTSTAGNVTIRGLGKFMNRNSVSSQVTPPAGINGNGGTGSGAPLAPTVNTGVPSFLNIVGNKAIGTETLTLEWYEVRMYS